MSHGRYDHKPPSVYTAQVPMEFMGHDFLLAADFRYRKGSPARWCKHVGTWDPPEPPEYDILRIVLMHDAPGGFGPKFDATGALFECLSELPAVVNAMAEEVASW